MTTIIRRTNSKWPVVTGLLTFLITGSTVALFSFQRLLLFKTNETKECSFAANAAKERVETILANSLSATKTLSFIVTKYNAENDFEEVAKKIIETNQYIDALELVRNGVITNVYPYEENKEAIGYNILNDSARNKEAQIAINKNELYFAGPILLKQHYKAIVGRLPIYQDSKFWGFAAVIIKLQTLLQAAAIDSSHDPEFSYQLSKVNPNTGIEEFFLPHPEIVSKGNVSSVTVPIGNWNIYVKKIHRNEPVTLIYLIIIGSLLSLTLSILAWVITRQPERLKIMVDEKTSLLKASEEKYFSFFELASDAILVTDFSGIITETNKNLCRLLGLKKEELLQQNINSLLEPGELKSKPFDFTALQNGETIVEERTFIKQDNTPTETELSAQKITGNRCMFIIRDISEIRKVQKQVTLSESVLRSAFENSSIGMALVSPKGQWLRVNRALSRMLGYSEKEMLALRFQDMTYPEDLEKDIAFMNKFFTGEENTRNTVKRYIRKNNSSVWTNVNISAVRNDAGLLEYFIVQIEDFTEKRHAQQEIIRLNRLYRFISEMNTSLLKSKSREEVFAEACRIAIDFGKFRMTWIGYNDASGNIIPVAWAGHIDGYLEKIKISIYEEPFSNGPTGQAIRNKTHYYCNDIANDINMAPWREEALKRNYHSSISLPIVVKGHLEAVYTLYMSEPDFFNETEINLLLGVTGNIAYALDKINLSELNKKAEAELKESEQKFRSLVEQSLAGVAILRDEKFLYVNPEFEKTVGYTKEQLLSKITIDKLVHEDDIERVKSNYAQRIKGGSPEPHYISKVIKSDGSILYIEIVASRISYNNQPAIIVTTIDITNRIEEEKKISAAVTEAQEKERMEIGMELHDNVKQILAASLLNIDFLISNPFNPDISITTLKKLKEYIKEAINETRRLSHQLSPSTDLDISLTEKIKTLIDDMQLSIDLDVALNIEEFEIPIPNMIQLSIYRIMQEQFANILKHARASKVWIAIKKEQNDILVLIKDNGKGFDNHLKKGGIGLENIQRRVLALNGKIEINTAPGKGCELIIHIPGSEINQH